MLVSFYLRMLKTFDFNAIKNYSCTGNLQSEAVMLLNLRQDNSLRITD